MKDKINWYFGALVLIVMIIPEMIIYKVKNAIYSRFI